MARFGDRTQIALAIYMDALKSGRIQFLAAAGSSEQVLGEAAHFAVTATDALLKELNSDD